MAILLLIPLLDIHLSFLACGMALARGMRGLLIDFYHVYSLAEQASCILLYLE